MSLYLLAKATGRKPFKNVLQQGIRAEMERGDKSPEEAKWVALDNLSFDINHYITLEEQKPSKKVPRRGR